MKTIIKLMLLSILYWGSASQAAHPSNDPVIAKIRGDFAAATTPSEEFLLENRDYNYNYKVRQYFNCRTYRAYGKSFDSNTFETYFYKFDGFVLSDNLKSSAFKSSAHYLFNNDELSAFTYFEKNVGTETAPLLKHYISRITLRVNQNNTLIAEFSTNEPTEYLTAPPLARIANPVEGEYAAAYVVCVR